MSECSGNISTDRPNYLFVLNKNSINSYNVLYWLTREIRVPHALIPAIASIFLKNVFNDWKYCNLIPIALRRTLSQLKTLKHGADRQVIGECVLLCYSAARACVVSQIFASFQSRHFSRFSGTQAAMTPPLGNIIPFISVLVPETPYLNNIRISCLKF